MADQGDADAEEHRIARRQHADRPALEGLDIGDNVEKRGAPRYALASVVADHGQVARPTDQHLGAVDQDPRPRR